MIEKEEEIVEQPIENTRLEIAVSFVEEKVGRAYNLTRDELREKVIVITGGELTVNNKE